MNYRGYFTDKNGNKYFPISNPKFTGERNKVYLDADNVEVIDGEKVVVEKEQEQKESDDTSSQDKFFETMGDE